MKRSSYATCHFSQPLKNYSRITLCNFKFWWIRKMQNFSVRFSILVLMYYTILSPFWWEMLDTILLYTLIRPNILFPKHSAVLVRACFLSNVRVHDVIRWLCDMIRFHNASAVLGTMLTLSMDQTMDTGSFIIKL